jgi:hypothetical protein
MILEQNLTETESYEKEIIWIKHYKDTGQCDANFTDGGDGVRVEKRWWNDAISKALRGIPRPKGKENKSFKDNISKEEIVEMYVNKGMASTEIGVKCGLSYTTVISRLRDYGIDVRANGKKSLPIRCTTDGKEFSSVNGAAKYYNLYRENIRKVLNGKYRHTGGKIFEYVTDNRRVSESLGKCAGSD